MKAQSMVALILILSACSSVRVVDYQKTINADLKSYKTFSYYQTEKSGLTGVHFENNLGHLKKAITTQMNTLGFKEAETGGDLLINIGVVVKEEVQTRETDFRTDGMRYMGQRNYHWESQEVEVDRYKEGTVRIDLVSAANNTGIWTGTVAGTVPDNNEKTPGRIDEAIALLFKKFPSAK